MPGNYMRFSVIVPTFNRCALLDQLLSALISQSFSCQDYEVIVVDNGSKDKTAGVVKHFQETSPAAVLYIYESRPGLHWARHAGAAAAHGEILAYLDDDTIPNHDWLEELDKAYTFFDADCAGGKIDIRWDRQPPEWVISYEPTLGRLDYGPEWRILDKSEFINGGNFTILRKRLFEIGGFNPDQINQRLIGDGETGLCLKIHKRGWKMIWVPKAIVSHIQLVDKNGTLRDIKRRFWNNGVGRAYNYYRKYKASSLMLSLKTVQCLMKSAKETLVGNIYCILAKRLCYYQHEMRSAFLAGEGLYYMRLIYDKELRKIALTENWLDLV
jgi:glycosyltransferase involved in cell wall biosynthesis